jgi:hypothetical protein
MLQVLAMLCLLTVGAIQPLTDDQQIQLATADDGAAVLDEGALYALLANVATWPAPASEAPAPDLSPSIPGAIIPDYAALRADPGKFRGQLFQIEGKIGAPADAFKLVRAGPWGAELTRWVIATGQSDPQAVLVYLVGVAAHDQPALRAPVRIPARFYRLLHTNDPKTGEPLSFLTFIGAQPRVLAGAGAGASGQRLGPNAPSIPTLLLLLVVMAGALMFLLRRTMRLSLQPRPTTSQQHRREEHQRRMQKHQPPSAPTADADADAGQAAALPDDPAAAMAELERRHGQP